MAEPSYRSRAWAQTMSGHAVDGGVVRSHAATRSRLQPGPVVDRRAREEREAATLRPGAALAHGAGTRAVAERPDPQRTCFERDRDRIVHSTAFRRLAGKTQVVVQPTDHQRTRLTHALEVAQVARSIAAGIGANVTLADAMALGHDCGHGPGGHASEEAFDTFLPEGFDHATWGADVALTSLNLCAETLDGIRNHSWSRPAPMTVEGEVVSFADRIAYCAHDLEDAQRAGIVTTGQIPRSVREVVGDDRRTQLATFIRSVIGATCATGEVVMGADAARALAGLREFNYERIYTRPESQAQSEAVISVLRGLVSYYLDHLELVPQEFLSSGADRVHPVVAYVAGMTDQFAFSCAEELLGWDRSRLPRWLGRGF
ncbi:HD domain-containing protein [Acidipropionibacterium jensenii]|uniref:HD domain-containing protein n=1 Tax=Acidipropionibacterium jensenii TaxID=1749 RepID=UPI000BC34B34|nr:HD domain-containing protein [Acidipropionibacterium jensenii]AZZ41952.1 HD domain-containing protein [Acidipropionibacterium jensenii]